MSTLTCDELRAMAAEVALGILSGAERADALDHMEHCVGCRALVEELAQTGDSLLLLAPEADPPMGFESRVASRVAFDDLRPDAPSGVRTHGGDEVEIPEIGPATPGPIGPTTSARRAPMFRHPRKVLAVAAAAAALVGGTAAATTLIDHSTTTRSEQAVDTTALRSGQFQATDGRVVGQLYAYSGNPSWVFMNVDASGASGSFTCELQLTNGTTVPLGQFEVHDGIGEWAHTVAVNVNQIKGAKLVTPAGLTMATARVS